MSTAVFYNQDPLGVEEAYAKHQSSPPASASQQPPLPPLAHLMPLTLSSSAQTNAYSSGPQLDFMYPVVSWLAPTQVTKRCRKRLPRTPAPTI